MNSLVFSTVLLDCRKGNDDLESYFAKLHVAVLRFGTIGQIGSSLTPPFTDNLCILAVPSSLLGQDFVEYNFL